MEPSTRDAAAPDRLRQVLVYLGLRAEDSKAPSPPISTPMRLLARVLLPLIYFGVVVLVSNDWGFAAAFAVAFAPLWQALERRRRRRARLAASPDESFPPTPLERAWASIPRPARTIVSIGAVTFAALLLWVVTMAFTQTASCDPVPGELHAFARAFCGTAGAATAAVVLDWTLILVVPLIALFTAVVAVTIARRHRGQLLGLSGAGVVAPIVLAWLLAGFH